MKKLITMTIASIIGAHASNEPLSLDQIKQHLQRTAHLPSGSVASFEQPALFQITNTTSSPVSLYVTVNCSDAFGSCNKHFSINLQPGELIRKLNRDLGDEFNSVQARNGDRVTINGVDIARIQLDPVSGYNRSVKIGSIYPGGTFDIS